MAATAICILIALFVSGFRQATTEEDGIVAAGECGPHPDVENARQSAFEGPPYPLDTVIEYTCEYGYVLDGYPHSVTCIPGDEPGTAEWTEPKIKCIPRSCGDPGFVTNARRIGSVFTFPNNVSYVCDKGYRLVGLQHRFCSTSGQWTGRLPSCEILSCSVPKDPENGKVYYDSLEYGSELRYECDKGYNLEAQEPRVCSVDGDWSGSEPICSEVQCAYPDAPAHGSVNVVGGKPHLGSIAIFTCNSGYTLVGSSTSKCLKFGDWTFPSPQCVEPCKVPAVANGMIGEKVRRYGRRQFVQSTVGSSIKDGTELFLRCDNGFEPGGKNKNEMKVLCQNGVWSDDPVCLPAACRSKFPTVANARLKTPNSVSHGTTLTYLCSKYFKKKVGNITCVHGVWQGRKPECTDTRCYPSSLNLNTVKPLASRVYQNGEKVSVVCKDGYESTDNDIVCSDGQWDISTSPCRPARCYLENLPQKEGVNMTGKGFVSSENVAEISCIEGYFLKYSGPKCVNGVWKFQNKFSPCQPSPCRVPKLQNGYFAELKMVEKWVVLYYTTTAEYSRVRVGRMPAHGTEYFVTCDSPFIFQGRIRTEYVKVVCNKGMWQPVPSCQEAGTSIMVSSAVSRPSLMTQVPTQTTVSPTSSNHVRTTQMIHKEMRVTDAVKAPEEALSEMNGFRTTTDQAEDCYCIYSVEDKSLVAYSGNEMVDFGSKVKRGCTVKFHCLLVGIQRLMGSPEISCVDCYWHSTTFPTCVAPGVGDAILRIEGTRKQELQVLPSGVVVLPWGVTANITCEILGREEWPNLRGPKNQRAHFAGDYVNHKYILIAYITIQSSDAQYYGRYDCKGLYGQANYIKIGAEVPKAPDAPEFSEVTPTQSSIIVKWAFSTTDDSVEGYRVSWHENSKVLGDKLLENAVNEYTVVNLNPSSVYTVELQAYNRFGISHPSSVTVKTLATESKLPDAPQSLEVVPSQFSVHVKWVASSPDALVDGYTITLYKNFSEIYQHLANYTQTEHIIDNLEPSSEYTVALEAYNSYGGSRALFKVVKTLEFKQVTCNVGSVVDLLPENVHLESVPSETVPSGAALNLTCEDPKRLIGRSTVNCTELGRWAVPSEVKCVIGCEPIRSVNDTSLRIEPKQEVYRLGDYVTFSCLPGHKLNSSVVRVMCLQGVWSSEIIPHCVETP